MSNKRNWANPHDEVPTRLDAAVDGDKPVQEEITRLRQRVAELEKKVAIGHTIEREIYKDAERWRKYVDLFNALYIAAYEYGFPDGTEAGDAVANAIEAINVARTMAETGEPL